MLSLVAAVTLICPAWHLRDAVRDGANPIGAQCGDCGRDVALRRDRPFANPICLYCGMDAGLVPLMEVEPHGA